MNKFVLLLLIATLFHSCDKEPLGKDYAFVRHKGAEMPVWVKGNVNADVFIIFLHGGPGWTSFVDIQNNVFSDIESQFAMVYYDQRASGNSIGHSSTDLLTLEQFTEDLHVIVQYIHTNYAPSKIVLMGHSWGGMLGTAYLLNPDYQNTIDGWIVIDGAHNLGQTAYDYSRDFVLNVADSLIEKQIDVSAWEKIKDYYRDHTTWRPLGAIVQHGKNVDKAGGYFLDKANLEGISLNQIFFSETDYIALLTQNNQVIKYMDVWHYDFTNRLHEINIPNLLLWGKADGILPVPLAHEAAAVMNLEEDQFYVFQESAHSPHYEQKALFNDKVIAFINKYIE